MPAAPYTPKTYGLVTQVTILTTARMTLNTGFRMAYPLLPVFARGVGTDIASIASILAIAQLIGLSAPFIGTISERRGRRFTILGGLLLYSIGFMAVYISPTFLGLACALIIGSLGKLTFDPSLQAYIGDRVPYERRGLVMGVIELAWSGAFLIGVPAMTWLIARYNWQTPFGVLSLLTFGGFLASFFILDRDYPKTKSTISFVQAFRTSLNSQVAIAGLVLAFGISAANQLVYVVFGSWIEASFGIMLSALAAASAVIGISELAGEGIVVFFSDRFGKRRLVILGICVNIIGAILLPFSNFSLAFALAGLFIFYISFELSLVASLPLATELSPKTRAMYMTVYIAALTFGRALATPLAPFIFQEYGLLANGVIAVALNIFALIAIWKFIDLD